VKSERCRPNRKSARTGGWGERSVMVVGSTYDRLRTTAGRPITESGLASVLHLGRRGFNSNESCWLNGKNRTPFNLLAFGVALGNSRTRRL
jgi:hypothetical protein